MRRSALDRWICDVERLPELSREEIRRLQLEKLNLLLARVSGGRGFYRGLPNGLSSLDELAKLPFTTKADISMHPNAFALVPQSGIEKIITSPTSGTTAPPERMFFTSGDIARTVSFYSAGISEFVSHGDRVLVMMPCTNEYSVGSLIVRAVEALGAEGVSFGRGRSHREAIDACGRLSVDSVIAEPVPMLSMARLAEADGTPLGLKGALVSADLCVPAVARAIESSCSCRIFPHYGSRETGLGCAVTCDSHVGMHVRENDIICETVDDNGNALRNGEWGELVVTTVGLSAMPLIRFMTGDRARLIEGVCECGSSILRLEARERSGSPMAMLDELLFTISGVYDYRVADMGEYIYVEIASISKVDLSGIAHRASEIMGKRAEARIADNAECPLYAGKRRVLSGGTE